MERKPLPGTARRDFQDRGGPSEQPQVWGQQSLSSNIPPQLQPLRYPTPTQLPEAVHLADELQRSLRSSNNSTAATTSSSTNHSLSHLRHDPGAGPSTLLHDFNTIVLPLVFLISFSAAVTAILVYTFAMNRVLPHRFTAVACIILVSILLTWGLCRWYEYCRLRRQAGRLWGLQEKDIEKALKYRERSDTTREPQSETSTKSNSIRKSILTFLSPLSSHLFKQPVERPTDGRGINEEHAQRNKKKAKRLSSVQIGGFGAGKYFQQDTREQFKLRRNIKQKEREFRRQSRKQMVKPSFMVGDDVTFIYRNRQGGNLMSRKEKQHPDEKGQSVASFAVGDDFTGSAIRMGKGNAVIEGGYQHPLSIVTTLWENACKDIAVVLPQVIAKRISGTSGLPIGTRSLTRTGYLYPSPSSTKEFPPSSSGINHLAIHHFHDEEKGVVSDLRREGELPASSFEGMGLGKPRPIPDDDRIGLNWSWKPTRKRSSAPTTAQKGKGKEVLPANEEIPPGFSSIPWGVKRKLLFSEARKPIPVSRVRFSQLETKPVRPNLYEFSAQEIRRERAFNGLLRQKGDVLIPTHTLALKVTSMETRIPPQNKEKDDVGDDNNKKMDNPVTNSPTILLHRSRTHDIICAPRSPHFKAKIYEEMTAPIPAFCRLT